VGEDVIVKTSYASGNLVPVSEDVCAEGVGISIGYASCVSVLELGVTICARCPEGDTVTVYMGYTPVEAGKVKGFTRTDVRE